MRRSSVVFIVCVVVSLPACSRQGARNIALQKQWNAKCKEAADLLAGVTDVASARAAEPKLIRVFDEWEKIGEQLDESYDPENVAVRDNKAMTEAAAQGIVEMQRLTQETLRISKRPELVEALGKAWKRNPSTMMLQAGSTGR